MSVIALRHAWRCVVCDEHGEGTSLAVYRAAAKHTEKKGHEFTPENTRYAPGGYRSCRACQRARRRAERAASPGTGTAFPCPSCHKSFKSRKALAVHKVRSHAGGAA